MKNKLLTCGSILFGIGSALGIIFCVTGLLYPLSFPVSLLIFPLVFITGGLIVIAIDSNNDRKRQQKMNEDLGLLILTFERLQKKSILNNMLANMLLAEIQEITDNGKL